MTIESDTREPEAPNGVGSSGDSENGDGAKTDDPQTTQVARSFGGQFLRFAGMGIIAAAILFSVIFWEDPGLLVGCLVLGSAGGVMHYKGRKLAPGKHGASILGGILGGITSFAALVILVLMVFAMFVEGCQEYFGL